MYNISGFRMDKKREKVSISGLYIAPNNCDAYSVKYHILHR